MSDHPQQLHLALEAVREPSLTEYLSGPNAEAVAAVSALAVGEGEPFLFLFGVAGTGKTHLLQAACLAAAQQGQQAHFVPLGTPELEPVLLDDLERLDLVAVDDVQAIAGDAAWEDALFDLFNRMRERGRRLLAAASAAPDALPLELPDLRSRLQWGPRYCLHPLTEADCEQLLVESAQRRGMQLNRDQVRYIMNYHARDPASLLDLVERLDGLSLREQRQPTIPLIRQALRE
ncbi:DnaA regulatory inactivator Hda [Thiobaca trueperi]|uniref:Regulatory inactivation of DnaA Hda protein n=1 Tax=Thiobaca trueperi TaxID=127458 RepID=A0A4R3MRP1_9GAMM|nr:DnaA regulatory inactivator Hda [Thiobaca trueperi]TCT17982.1 regulatory inactivation of DnaA Hda protein [Thiobaca trueperi]